MDGIILPVLWFETSVNFDVFLEKELRHIVWPTVKAVATRLQYWFQQDGSICDVTAAKWPASQHETRGCEKDSGNCQENN